METKTTYGVYWHRGCNSGLYEFDKRENALKCAIEFSELEGMYDVIVLDMTRVEKIKVGE